MVMQRNWHW